jgi:hypothetical protein
MPSRNEQITCKVVSAKANEIEYAHPSRVGQILSKEAFDVQLEIAKITPPIGTPADVARFVDVTDKKKLPK